VAWPFSPLFVTLVCIHNGWANKTFKKKEEVEKEKEKVAEQEELLVFGGAGKKRKTFSLSFLSPTSPSSCMGDWAEKKFLLPSLSTLSLFLLGFKTKHSPCWSPVHPPTCTAQSFLSALNGQHERDGGGEYSSLDLPPPPPVVACDIRPDVQQT
jgi:hypothetical protein